MEMESGATRSWFDKPEGKVGAVGIAVLVALFSIGMYFALPFILVLLTNTLHTMLLLGAIGGLLLLVVHPTSRNFFCMAYKMLFKGLTSIFITIDPMMILRDYVQQLYKNLKDMADQIGIVKGTHESLKRKIKEYSDTAEQLMAKHKKALEVGNKKVAATSHRAAERRRVSVQKLTVLSQKIEMILRVLHKMHDNCSIMADDTKDEIDMKQDEWEAMKNATSAMRSAMSMINGGGDKRANYEQALEFMVDDISAKMGEMSNFMDMTEGLMDSIDLDNAMFDDKAVESLEKWESDSESWILGGDKSGLVDDSKDPNKDFDKENFSVRQARNAIFK